MHHGVKSGGDASKAESDVYRSDTYQSISNLCNLCRGMSYILVMTSSSFSPVCIAEPEEEVTCDWSPAGGVSSVPRSFPANSARTPGVCMPSCEIGQSAK